MTRGPVPPSERSERAAKARIRKQATRDKYLKEARDFLLWMREKPRAFVVFRKADLIALRKP